MIILTRYKNLIIYNNYKFLYLFNLYLLNKKKKEKKIDLAFHFLIIILTRYKNLIIYNNYNIFIIIINLYICLIYIYLIKKRKREK